MRKSAIVIHGGAGTIPRNLMDTEKRLAYEHGLSAALLAGQNALSKGLNALEASILAVEVLEDNPLFNAGRGAVFANSGKHEMDASLMCGKTLSAGAVAGVQGVKNPVRLAQMVMDHSGHVMLCGHEAVAFGQKHGIVCCAEDYFFDQFRFDQWQEIKDSDQYQLDHTPKDEKRFGTVGAVALDLNGNIAAATSTGGMTNKKYGRVGDTPIIGAGTYADNQTCAISCTGHGEFFIRAVVAHDIASMMRYGGKSLAEACQAVVMEKLVAFGGEGGLVAIDAQGNICMPFNSDGMYRGFAQVGEQPQVFIYK